MLRSASRSADSAVTDTPTFCWSSIRRLAVMVMVVNSPRSTVGAAGAVCASAVPAPIVPKVPKANARARDKQVVVITGEEAGWFIEFLRMQG